MGKASWLDEKSSVISPSNVVKHQGVFDFDMLLKEIHAWLNKTGYFIKYKDQTETPKPQGMDFRLEWFCDRQPTPYFKFFIELEFIGRNLTEVSVEKNGKKVKMVQGDFEMYFKSHMLKNYNRLFPVTPFGQLCRKLYEHYGAYRKMQRYWGILYSETYALMDVAKAVLNAYR